MNVATPAFADKALGKPMPLQALTEAIGEMNTSPDTLTDEDQARALQRILARRGWHIQRSR